VSQSAPPPRVQRSDKTDWDKAAKLPCMRIRRGFSAARIPIETRDQLLLLQLCPMRDLEWKGIPMM